MYKRIKNTLPCMVAVCLSICVAACHAGKGNSIKYQALTLKAAAGLTGNFIDDYGITYTITDSVFTQAPGIRYRIIRWDTTQQFCIAYIQPKEPTDSILYTRIDYMRFTGMAPWLWGYCFTTYTAKNEAEAVTHPAANRQNPRKGCNGYPFSRMKRQ
jgi:hypothetical protein